MQRTVVFGLLAAMTSVAIWGGNFIASRYLSSHVPPIGLAFFRWSVGFLVLAPFALRPMIRQRRVIFRNFPMIALTAFFGVTSFNTLIYFAGATTAAVKMALIAALIPALMIVSDRVLFRTPITGRKLAGLIVAFLGVAFLVSGGDPISLLHQGFALGDLLMLGASASFAFYSTLLKYRPPQLDPNAHLGAMFLIGIMPLFPAYLWESAHVRPVIWDATTIYGIAYVGIVASAVAYFCWNIAVRDLGSTRSAMVYYTIPLATAFEAVLILGEAITPVHGISFAIIIGGILLARK